MESLWSGFIYMIIFIGFALGLGFLRDKISKKIDGKLANLTTMLNCPYCKHEFKYDCEKCGANINQVVWVKEQLGL